MFGTDLMADVKDVELNERNTDHPAPSSSWKFVAVFLWIICLGLLFSVGYLAIEMNKKPFQLEGCPGNISSNKEANKSGEVLLSDLFSSHSLQNFIIKLSKMQCGLQKDKFFISLYYDNQKLKWVWRDGTDLTLDKLPVPGYENAHNKCVHIKYGQIITEDCQSRGYCICKKTMYPG
ncbi:killer cell lectin-like receptor subfamily B member 1B allele A-like protein [Camelus ferus]|nr:killer cell lectin-like receptor subfamily B member 1B allele A-like protein [Camelus ferus]